MSEFVAPFRSSIRHRQQTEQGETQRQRAQEWPAVAN